MTRTRTIQSHLYAAQKDTLLDTYTVRQMRKQHHYASTAAYGLKRRRAYLYYQGLRDYGVGVQLKRTGTKRTHYDLQLYSTS